MKIAQFYPPATDLALSLLTIAARNAKQMSISKDQSQQVTGEVKRFPFTTNQPDAKQVREEYLSPKFKQIGAFYSKDNRGISFTT